MSRSGRYANSAGGLISTLEKLRKVFPSSVTTKTLAQWGFAPKNERYVIGVLKYLGLIDEDGKKSAEASRVFSHHNDADFEEAFGKIVRERYSGLFEIHGDDTWTGDQGDLVSFFRHEDETSDTVGARQARTFQGALYARLDLGIQSRDRKSRFARSLSLHGRNQAERGVTKLRAQHEVGHPQPAKSLTRLGFRPHLLNRIMLISIEKAPKANRQVNGYVKIPLIRLLRLCFELPLESILPSFADKRYSRPRTNTPSPFGRSRHPANPQTPSVGFIQTIRHRAGVLPSISPFFIRSQIPLLSCSGGQEHLHLPTDLRF